MHKVPFVSQRDYAFQSVACGVAATMMLLKHHFRRKRVPSYRELRKALGIDGPPSQSRRRDIVLGAGPQDVTNYFRRHGISYRATHHKSRATWTTVKLRLQRAPLMVGMGKSGWRWGKSGHWIVLIGIDAETITYLDPQFRRGYRRPSRLRIRDFRRQWDGTSIQIAKAR